MKKKIVFVLNNFLIGGTEKFLASLIKYLDKDIFDIKIVTILGRGPIEQEFKVPGVEITSLGPDQYPKSWFKKITHLILSFFKLTVFLYKNKPDVVITSLWQSDIAGIFSAFLNRVPKRILIQHDVQPLNLIIKRLKMYLAINLATNIVANSSTVRDFLLDYFKAHKSKPVIIYNGVDFQHFKATNAISGDIVLGSVSRLEPVKGHIYAIEALRILKEKGLEPKYFVYGDGITRKELEHMAEKYALNNITFFGEELNLIKAFNSFNVFLAPSLSEGFGLAAIQALAAGRIVISSDLPAIREFITNQYNGLLVEPKNPVVLAEAIERLIRNQEIFDTLKTQTINWANGLGRKFDINNIAKEYERLINEVS